MAEGSPGELQARRNQDVVQQFMSGAPDGPVPFHYPAPDYLPAVARAAEPMRTRSRSACRIGRSMRWALTKLGAVRAVPAAGARAVRPGAGAAAAGGRSRSTTPAPARWSSSCCADCSSAWCWGCRATICCSASAPSRRSAWPAALGLIKELGPVLTALLFAGRAGTALRLRDRSDGRDRSARRRWR